MISSREFRPRSKRLFTSSCSASPRMRDIVTIKAAFRTKAKRLHPDFNPSPIAAKQFNRLHEAYATLIDPRKRNAYDRPWKRAGAKRADGPPPNPKPQDQAEPRAQSRTAEQPQEKPERSGSRTEAPEPPPRRVNPDTPVVCQCGKVTAQPRYIVFDMVWGTRAARATSPHHWRILSRLRRPRGGSRLAGELGRRLVGVAQRSARDGARDPEQRARRSQTWRPECAIADASGARVSKRAARSSLPATPRIKPALLPGRRNCDANWKT